MREILARAGDGDEAAQLALDVYVHRLRGAIASMAAALEGLDALVFTGGAAERSPAIRSRAVDGLHFRGVSVDDHLNGGAVPDCEITDADARARVLVIQAREDLEIPRQARAALERRATDGSR